MEAEHGNYECPGRRDGSLFELMDDLGLWGLGVGRKLSLFHATATNRLLISCQITPGRPGMRNRRDGPDVFRRPAAIDGDRAITAKSIHILFHGLARRQSSKDRRVSTCETWSPHGRPADPLAIHGSMNKPSSEILPRSCAFMTVASGAPTQSVSSRPASSTFRRSKSHQMTSKPWPESHLRITEVSSPPEYARTTLRFRSKRMESRIQH